jgi:hypothetical protein
MVKDMRLLLQQRQLQLQQQQLQPLPQLQLMQQHSFRSSRRDIRHSMDSRIWEDHRIANRITLDNIQCNSHNWHHTKPWDTQGLTDHQYLHNTDQSSILNSNQ